MVQDEEFKKALKNYRQRGNNDIYIGRNSISIALDTWNFSIGSIKNEVIAYLNKEGFTCSDAESKIGQYPSIKIFDAYYKIEMRVCGGGYAIIPVQSAILTPIKL